MSSSINEVTEMIDGVAGDPSVPRNIRKTLTDAKDRLLSKEEDNIKVSAATYLIESISDDVNMPAHARTQIWAIISALESIKSK